MKKIFNQAVLVLSITLSPIVAFALPSLTSVQDGQATIINSHTTTTINQTLPATTIQWNSFNLQANEQVIFNQPSTSAIGIG